jgi:hypothetical protein
MKRYSFFLLYAALCIAVPLRARGGAAQPAAADSLLGAVHTVDVRAKTIDVTTGVGEALRVVHLQVAVDTRITETGAPLALALLQPGDIVRVSWGSRAQGVVAYTIERIGRVSAGPGGKP